MHTAAHCKSVRGATGLLQIAGFSATAKGCSYFPFSGSTLADDLRHYDKTKSSLHFKADKPLPASRVRKLVRARIAETSEG